MRLRDLFSDDATIPPRAEATAVSGLAVDSRAVKPGAVFFAIAGARTDGARFIEQAIASGAVAVAGDHPPRDGCRVPFVITPNPRRALALAAAKYFPRQPATIAAVTGTSGKTSVVAFTRQIWLRLGHASASIGTIGLVSPNRTLYGSLTTPDPIALHRQLDEIAREGVTHLALEASSHGLDQYRLDGVRVTAGGFTNLSRDHMDYHPDIAHYLAAKLRLFRDLVAADGAAVISADHDYSQTVIDAARARNLRIVAVGRNGNGAGEGIRLVEAAIDGFAQQLTLEHRGKKHAVRLPLVGEFQIENALVAAGLAIGTGSELQIGYERVARRDPTRHAREPKAVVAELEVLEGAKGRLERVAERNGAPIFVDYAHKPDALAKALQALRPYARRKLVVVFGAGGDRDAGKRPLMGAIAVENADQVIVTDDNPRSECPEQIRAAILSTAKGASEIGDRAEAIRTAIAALQPGDALLIAGKGHETGQIVGNTTLPFSDHDAVASALAPRVA
jgi:UDP-N-acetylmuramoyl-L-alanyl-D-glutamate--2,6-diaminopimelate ligase